MASPNYQNSKFVTRYNEGSADNEVFETFKFNGIYAIEEEYVNPAAREGPVKYDDYEEAVHCKAVYFSGNILYKTDEPKIWHYIDLIIEATHKNEFSVPVDTSVKKRTQMVGGTICPTEDILFLYDGKLFVLYGRYIYGYNQPYVRFANANPKAPEEENEDDDDYEDFDEDSEDRFTYEKERPALLSEDEVVLPTIPYKGMKNKRLERVLNDYNYSFKILDQSSETLLAFGLYR